MPTGNWLAIRLNPSSAMSGDYRASTQAGQRERERQRDTGEKRGKHTRKLSKQDDGAAAEAEQVVAASAVRNHIMWQLQQQQQHGARGTR